MNDKKGTEIVCLLELRVGALAFWRVVGSSTRWVKTFELFLYGLTAFSDLFLSL